jgi:hypothetical protein
MQTQRLIGAALGASLVMFASAAGAQTWPANDEAAKAPSGSYSGAPAGEGPGSQGSQGLVLRGNGVPLPDANAPGVVVVVPPSTPSTTVIVPAPVDQTAPPVVVVPAPTQ